MKYIILIIFGILIGIITAKLVVHNYSRECSKKVLLKAINNYGKNHDATLFYEMDKSIGYDKCLKSL